MCYCDECPLNNDAEWNEFNCPMRYYGECPDEED